MNSLRKGEVGKTKDYSYGVSGLPQDAHTSVLTSGDICLMVNTHIYLPADSPGSQMKPVPCEQFYDTLSGCCTSLLNDRTPSCGRTSKQLQQSVSNLGAVNGFCRVATVERLESDLHAITAGSMMGRRPRTVPSKQRATPGVTARTRSRRRTRRRSSPATPRS